MHGLEEDDEEEEEEDTKYPAPCLHIWTWFCDDEEEGANTAMAGTREEPSKTCSVWSNDDKRDRALVEPKANICTYCLLQS